MHLPVLVNMHVPTTQHQSRVSLTDLSLVTPFFMHFRPSFSLSLILLFFDHYITFVVLFPIIYLTVSGILPYVTEY